MNGFPSHTGHGGPVASGGPPLIEHPQNSVDPIVTAWISAGGVPGTNTVAALDTMIKRWRTGGYFSKVAYFNLMCGADFASCLIPQIQGAGTASMTSVSFTSADYSESTGLTGNGTTKHLDIGASLETILGGIATGGLGIYLRALQSTVSTRGFVGTSNGTDIFQLRQSTTPTATSAWGGNSQGTSVSAQMPVGWNHIDRSGPTLLTRYSAGSSVGTFTTNTVPAGNGFSVFVFALNSSGTASTRISGPLAGVGIFQTMTAGEALDLAQSIQVAQTTLGRQV